ncbi:hypothetical protein RGR602_CH01573 [Rhizobium gallicum bv. gallicum R602sp]|uniref:Uncharacterized protein n=1 Tax=Rhizobium gallicum bv. gallicum R602sp TaxID=1041138 RepID=A0A0B4X2Y2_9HYPH|nr:hypothetical protein RGR602_CH01573 [Rhizobium gallicum bv. gallicum R602sp]
MTRSKPAATGSDVLAELKDRIIVSSKVHIVHVANSAMNYEAIATSQLGVVREAG